MSDEKQEVADAVIAEMRDEAARADTEQYYTLDDAAESMREYANRLEAALKRERAAFDCECAGIAELAAKEEAARHRRESVTDCNRTGNAAAMRETLEAVDKIYDMLSKPCIVIEEVRHACQKARAVLISTPQRNCDMPYYDRVEMYGAFKDWCKAKGHTMEPMLACDAFEWLLATATENGGAK